MENKCLYCYLEIDSKEIATPAGKAGFHQKCSKKFFGTPNPPRLDFGEDQILQLAEQVIKSQKTVTGVQPKLSLGLWGEYILKPQTSVYSNLPENEDLTMHLAEISRIKTVDHSLIKLKTGQLAYITKRIDRNKGKKLHIEDMCQLTERLTEQKYKGSYEQIAKAIKRHSLNPGLDITNFYELVIFCFLTGNNDMHLKNFSLLKVDSDYSLCPAYDLVASELVVEGDEEDLALNLNGRKKRIKKRDFEIAMRGAGLDQKVIENTFAKFHKLIPKWHNFIDLSFLPNSTKSNYQELIKQKAEQIEIKSF